MRDFALLIFLSFFFVSGLIVRFIPEGSETNFIDSLPIVCPLRRWTGFLCSFCGMTHAWIFFWHGEWARAFSENALSIPLFAGAPVVVLSILCYRPFWTETRVRRAITGLIVILAGYTILRNLRF